MQPEPEQQKEKERFANPWPWRLGFGACLALLAAAILPPILQTGTHEYAVSPCLVNVKELALAQALYGADYDDRLPPARWMDALAKYAKQAGDKNADIFRCPNCPVKGGYGYAMHKPLAGLLCTDPDTSATVVLFFDSTLSARNALGGFDTLPAPGRHKGLDFVAFLDGHVKAVKWGRPLDENARRLVEDDRRGRHVTMSIPLPFTIKRPGRADRPHTPNSWRSVGARRVARNRAVVAG